MQSATRAFCYIVNSLYQGDAALFEVQYKQTFKGPQPAGVSAFALKASNGLGTAATGSVSQVKVSGSLKLAFKLVAGPQVSP